MTETPKITVIIPVYNADKYLAASIQSILDQDYKDYELIIIDDGSSDNSLGIMKTFKDHRITIIENGINKGLIYSLNYAINIARGKYIAHMHADDIAIPSRLSKQFAQLELNPEIDILAGFINLINSNGEYTGIWELDHKANSRNVIKKEMAYYCCIAHPSVMGKTSVFKKHLYYPAQKNIEDYDIWLRMIADDVIIEKLNEPILNYRVHNQSTTHIIYNGKNVFFKIANCKIKFIVNCLKTKKINGFVLRVFISMIGNYIMSVGKAIKNIFIHPAKTV